MAKTNMNKYRSETILVGRGIYPKDNISEEKYIYANFIKIKNVIKYKT